MKMARYAQVLRRLRRLPDDAEVLEVGSAASGLGTWWGRSFVGVDLSFDESPLSSMRPVVADASRLPFEDGRFDFVVSVDMLQEVPRELLESTCTELVRVASKTVVVVAACGTDAEASDLRMLEWCRERGLEPPSWLPSQAERGLPSPEAIRSLLAPYGRLDDGPNTSVRWQERMFRVERRPGLRRVRAMARPFLRLWGRWAPTNLPGDREEVYGRWFVLELERTAASRPRS